ncbi:MAG TPA: 2-C-methyl-D-erythritol 4-phosphate cytidylyltransferase [Patescibacteria group bacterium]|nr:2-C-methyl-D-erythritol 4-phosphate cytidylyltransferase [Patescibacteria group bacterium]
MNIAIILASGVGKRMGAEKNKVLLNIDRRPVIFYAIKAFEKNNDIEEIIIVTRKEEFSDFKKLAKKYKFKKIKGVVAGGKERQDSAYNGLKYLDEKATDKNDIIVFHNGANPFVTTKEISESIKEAKRCGACVVAHPTKDTVKEVNKRGLVEKTLERKKLWCMQTPQTIRYELALEAFKKANKDKFLGTDDVSLVERLGNKVKVILGSPHNMKITTPLDFKLAKIIIRDYEF